MFSLSLALLTLCACYCSASETYKWPTVGISVLVRNKAHTLPYFLTCIQRLEYPKDRIYIWIHSENNEDESTKVLEAWTKEYGPQYSNIYMKADTSVRINLSVTQWDDARFRHVIGLRENAFNFARQHLADFILMIDADAFLTDKMTLKNLVSKNMSVVAPMLISDGLYSNFWCGMSDKYYYERTEAYKPILNRKDVGCFDVPMVHTAVLINLREVASDRLTYDPKKLPGYDGPVDDIITFAISAKKNNVKLTVCNELEYGYVTIPQEDQDQLADDYEQLLNVKLEALGRGGPLPLDDHLAQHVRYLRPWKYSFDQIFMINLLRRKEKRQLMEQSFMELGMDVNIVNAVDGKGLSHEELTKRSIKLMKNYEDPYHRRPMKMGEIGCFLSHYNLWQEIVEKKYGVSLILEDDVHFEPYFRNKMALLLQDLRGLQWDLVYIGRKVLLDQEEQAVTEHIVKPLYSYWTLGYILKLSGAQKLLDAKPLDNLLPVDEFLPIMFNQHPNATWKSHFPLRNLIALSASPQLIKPSRYTGEPGYISDTEGSDIIPLKDETANPRRGLRSDL